MYPTCNLHTHSLFSDGTYTPDQIIDEAIQLGLSSVALSDHNTCDGLPDFLAAAQGKPIRAIPGVEFSVDYEGTELHLLGLFIDPIHFPAISRMMDQVMARKERSNIDLIEKLNRAGYALDYARIKNRCANGKVNRVHIAAEMVEKGYVPSIQYAFQTILSADGPYYTPPQRLSVWEVLSFIRSIKAVPVLAHPFLSLSEQRLHVFLPEAVKQGLVGMETAYSTYDVQATALAQSMADRYGLLPSGGSDFHGSNKPDIRLGVGKGNLAVPQQWADDLERAI